MFDPFENPLQMWLFLGFVISLILMLMLGIFVGAALTHKEETQRLDNEIE